LVLPSLDNKCAKAIERALSAKCRHYDPLSKKWTVSDDVRAQLEAVKLFYAYKFGMPVQRQIRIEANFKDNDEQLFALVNSSPEARKELIAAGVVTEHWIEAKAKKLK
jgi:hypothetical protein